MTAVEIATGMIDKLQKENRECLDALHEARQTIKHLEHQVGEKERLIKVLQERIRMGTDGILEMTNRQKELTIKHLEMQIQKLLKENEDLELRLETIKAHICAKCETKLLLVENNENRNATKSFKSTGKTSSIQSEKKTSQSLCPNRLKSLERIIEHKQKRIVHLSKEVQRLTKTENELTQKIYRLTKLLPMSRMPPETLTDCLLKEIQLLESERQSHEKFQPSDGVSNLKKDKLSLKNSLSSSKVGFLNSSEKLKKASTSNTARSAVSIPELQTTDALDTSKAENEVLCKKLQKLCSDVNELKRLFAFESDKLSQGLHSTAAEYSIFKSNLEEIIDNLNDVVQSILNNNFLNIQDENVFASSSNSDDKFVISCLQKRLKESLEIITEYENENKMLHEELNQLRKQMANQGTYHTSDRNFEDETVTVDSNRIQYINDVKKLKEAIKIKDTQLEAAESHINTCQKFIEELQKTIKKSTFEGLKIQTGVEVCNNEKTNFCEQQNKILQTKLNVAEKNIKTCETVIEQLQNSVRRLEEENVRIESELHMIKSQKISLVNDQSCKTLQTKFSTGETQINFLKKVNQELQDKIKTLEEVNLKLEKDMKNYEEKNIILEATEQEKGLLKTKIDASEKQICSLEKSMETLQNKLMKVECEKKQLENNLKSITETNNLAETYETVIAGLKNDLNEKEKKNKDLEESLHTLENKAKEMNYHRKNLFKEIENLCKVLMEKEDNEDNFRRKSIYKAAVLHSAQALLRLDGNYQAQPEDSGRNSALEEMKHQIQVYLTEVARIHELVTIKEHERDELLKEYLDLGDDVFKPSSFLHHQSHFQGESADKNLQSSPHVSLTPVQPDLPAFCNEGKSTKTSADTHKHASDGTFAQLKVLQEELAATKSVTTYLLSSCTRLEELLAKERMQRAQSERELEVQHETISELKSQLNMKNSLTKRLNTLIEMMRSKECNDEITLEQMQSEIKWLIDENQKIFERITSTQAELCQCKEENSRIQNELDTLKRQLLNEKYEHAKVNNELKHLRLQISNSHSALNDTN